MDTITCLQTVRGDHHKLVINLKNCKCSILHSVLLQFNISHWYLYMLLIIYFSSILDSERSRVMVWNTGTPFQNLSDLYYNYYYDSVIYLIVFYLWLTFGFPLLNLFTSFKKHSTQQSPFGIPGARTEHKNNLRVKTIVESKIFFCLKLIGNIVNKLIWYCYQSSLAW